MKYSKTQFEKMPKSENSEPESEENDSSSSEAENGTANVKGRSRNDEQIPEYEKQRLKRIEENKSRMEALGLRKMATSFMGSVQKSQKKKNEKKGKTKMADEDKEYNPTEDDDEMSFSEEGDENDAVSRKKKKKKNEKKGKRKMVDEDEEYNPTEDDDDEMKKNTLTPKKQAPIQRRLFNSVSVDDDDDDALMKAIALSLQDSSGFLDEKSNSPSQGNIATSRTPTSHDKSSDKRNEILDDAGKKRRKKTINSRVQMSEDEMIVHFFQFDETGRGGFTFRDIQRLALAHDFTWSEKEISDMIFCFDTDGDGKINLNDFRKIVDRCNMLKGPEMV